MDSLKHIFNSVMLLAVPMESHFCLSKVAFSTLTDSSQHPLHSTHRMARAPSQRQECHLSCISCPSFEFYLLFGRSFVFWAETRFDIAVVAAAVMPMEWMGHFMKNWCALEDAIICKYLHRGTGRNSEWLILKSLQPRAGEIGFLRITKSYGLA